jgi:hypothetical protein
VNPTRSAKSTDTIRRSVVAVGGAGAASMAVPHAPQNRSPGSFAAPHAGQAMVSSAPHWAQ